MVNDARLAMSTMNIIQLKEGSPANFLDVGGGSNETQASKDFKLLNSDSNIEAMLLNVLRGIDAEELLVVMSADAEVAS